MRRALKYRADIDGLRAVAVTAVVGYHCGLKWLPGGFVGVDIFFVISGYLIGSLVYKEIRGRSFSIATFYQRRAKRILPALSAMLGFCYVVGLLLLTPGELKEFSNSALATIASGSNFYFLEKAHDYFGGKSVLKPLLMTWTLGVEEQFYILFPLLMLMMRARHWRTQFGVIGGLTAVSFAAAVVGTQRNPPFAFYMLPARAWELAAGVLLALYESNRPQAVKSMSPVTSHAMSVLGLALIGIALGVLSSTTPFPGYAALLPVMGAVLVIRARDGVVNRILSWQSIAFVGLISYSWYLWHWPLLSFGNITSDVGLSVHSAVSICLLAFGAAILSYFVVERPFRASTTPTKVLLWRYGALAAGMALAPAIFIFAGGLPQRNQKAAHVEGAEEMFYSDKCHTGSPHEHPLLKPPCVPTTDGPAVALIGDSHAAALAPALRSISASRGYQFAEMAMGYCPPLGGGVSRTLGGLPGLVHHCDVFNRERFAYIAHDPNIKVVIADAWWADGLKKVMIGQLFTTEGQESASVTLAQSRMLLESGLRSMIEQLSADGRTIYLVEDCPEFSFDPDRLLKTRLIGLRTKVARVVARPTARRKGESAEPSYQAEDNDARQILAKVAADYPNVHLIDLRSALCENQSCKFADGDQAFYIDEHHLTRLGAQVALSGFRLP